MLPCVLKHADISALTKIRMYILLHNFIIEHNITEIMFLIWIHIEYIKIQNNKICMEIEYFYWNVKIKYLDNYMILLFRNSIF